MQYFLASVVIDIGPSDITTAFFIGADNEFHARKQLDDKIIKGSQQVVSITLRDVTESMSDGFIIQDIEPTLVIFS